MGPGGALRALLAAGAVLAAGASVAAAPGAAAAAAPVVRLTVRYDPGGPAAPRTATLRCGVRAVATGYLRASAARACRVARMRAPLLATTPPEDRVCTLIYGGPQTARVRGTIGARAVDRRFSRSSGCEIADWNAVTGLLPRTRGAG